MAYGRHEGIEPARAADVCQTLVWFGRISASLERNTIVVRFALQRLRKL
jgi:hypothetical protein